MKLYFLRFRHVRGWYCSELCRNQIVGVRLMYTLTSYFDLRFIDWMLRDPMGVALSNEWCRETGLVLLPLYSSSGVLVVMACRTRSTEWAYAKGATRVRTHVLHRNAYNVQITEFARVESRYGYQILPQYI